MGIQTDNLLLSLLPWSILTLVFAIGLFFVLQRYPILFQLWHQLYPSVGILIFLAAAQELFFRGYLMKVLRGAFKRPVAVILIDAILFAAMHLVFAQRTILVPEAFIAGIGFAWIYYYYPNVILASLSHALLNWIIIPFCLFRMFGC